MLSLGGFLSNGAVLIGTIPVIGSSVGNGIESGSLSFFGGGGESLFLIGPFGGTLFGFGGTGFSESAFFGGTGGGAIMSDALLLPTAEADDGAESLEVS